MSRWLKIIGCIAVLTSCKKMWVEENEGAYASDFFNELWNEVNDNYVFFELKNIDWKAAYNTNYPLISTVHSEEALFHILGKTLAELKDGHCSLYAGFDTWKYHEIYSDSPSNYNRNFVEKTYLNPIRTIGPFTYSILTEEIGYIHYASFGDDFSEEELTALIQYMNVNSKGLIIDVRDNQGGALDNVLSLMRPFVNEEKVIGESYYPNLEGELELAEHLTVKPDNDIGNYEHESVVLSNRKCYSACSTFIGFMKSLDAVTVVGDTTSGGAGLAVSSDLSNGWKFRYSAGKITLPNGIDMELGIAPDAYILTGASQELLEEDALIEKALEILN